MLLAASFSQRIQTLDSKYTFRPRSCLHHIRAPSFKHSGENSAFSRCGPAWVPTNISMEYSSEYCDEELRDCGVRILSQAKLECKLDNSNYKDAIMPPAGQLSVGLQ